MENRDVGFLRGPARRLRRETAGTQTFEAALFAGAVLAASVFAFSATGGSMGRVIGRMTAVFGCADAGGADLGGAPPSARRLDEAPLLLSASEQQLQAGIGDREEPQAPPAR